MKQIVICIILGLACPGIALGQSYYSGPGDPCLPVAQWQNPFSSAGATQARDAACTAERQAQWTAYYNHQAILKQQQDEEAESQSKRQAQEAEESRVEASRQEHAQEILVAEQRRQQRNELVMQHNNYAALIALEDAPDNYCKTPDVARLLMQEWSDFDIFKNQNIRAVDIAHLTTVAFNQANGTMTCHGVFEATSGLSIIGSLQVRKNVAGDLIENWIPDPSQDMSAYVVPPPLDADTLKSIAVGSQTDATSVAPVATSADTTHLAPPPEAGMHPLSDGLADRQRWEGWFTGLTGSEKDGATWYSANRSLSGTHDCSAQPKSADAPWLAGCLNAQERLTPIDLKRKSEPQYKRGWNSF